VHARAGPGRPRGRMDLRAARRPAARDLRRRGARDRPLRPRLAAVLPLGRLVDVDRDRRRRGPRGDGRRRGPDAADGRDAAAPRRPPGPRIGQRGAVGGRALLREYARVRGRRVRRVGRADGRAGAGPVGDGRLGPELRGGGAGPGRRAGGPEARMIFALLLSALSGFIALSYEILWYRAYSLVSGGAAPAFALLLAMYLAGLALGSRFSKRFCESGDVSLSLGRFILIANLLGYLFVPTVSWLVTLPEVRWTWTLPLVAVVACGLGTILPLVSHHAVPPDARAGARVSWIYFANIVGSASGSLVTGFWLTDHWSLRAISLFLAVLGAVMGAIALQAGGRRAVRFAAAASVAVLAAVLNPWIFDGLYERMVQKTLYNPSSRFLHVVENRSGVITVYKDGTFLGGGRYDGSVNTSLLKDRNGVFRAYAVAGLHARPREILMIGLSTGSWA